MWQLGDTTRADLPGTTYQQLDAGDFARLSKEADVVITHAGAGTILDLLGRGIYPVVVPRRASRNEHVDDHQSQIAGLLRSRGIAAVSEVTDLDSAVIVAASGRMVRPRL